ncbi:Pyridoxal-5'-phosphate-dependent protein beta subunit [Pseudarthrobacter chlorophenolicus A6]|uniref:Pyridoxal-5'-phosphate-dependent protein beta subunit n=1 Tax=Pseudarthrobacter chlorophenolicus (strain ATCC 700700 / DSM 12829 / CIP 107037 / JCM 12360 / KCTC 9906 / NCIMB 13794 / A6) TaxID=452863 RepID=B8H9Q5_PSECP|nr:cysteine synthase family protein [Pseudarthrobacter chlorophenolicus]ACL38289.1 Pyridoxal-5'-phosphate-dependent protein beta subunit [Pseudarthrobacter chlorophenolicus A6]SDQ51624.1 cystathionine beta-synthase [Pseudarthrobacter chlorophenolicus]
MTVFESVLDGIGSTPLVRLRRLGAGLRPRIYAKLEFQNIGGSVKDRAALSMVRAAERQGLLRPGGTVVEGTSGNTGIGLAMVAAQLGYRAVIFAPAATAAEKIRLLRAYGAEVHLVADFVPRDHPGHLASRAAAFAAETPGAWLAQQYDNPANPAAHRHTTGPEIWADTEGSVTHLVASVGTGGTLSGTGGFLKDASGGSVQVVAADPEHSRYGGGDGALKYVEGAGHALHPESVEDIWPEAFDTNVVDRYLRVSDRDAIFTARRAACEEGLLTGATGGTALAAALNLAEGLDESHTIVVVLPDSGRNYLSTYFDDGWLASLGFLEPDSPQGTVRSLLPSGDAGGQAAGVPLLPSGLAVGESIAHLRAQGLGPADPAFLVLDRGARHGSVHPREVLAAVTLESLQALDSQAGPSAAALLAAVPYRAVGAGTPAPGAPGEDGASATEGDEVVGEAGAGGDAANRGAAGAGSSVHEVLAVLVDGRITAAVPAGRRPGGKVADAAAGSATFSR